MSPTPQELVDAGQRALAEYDYPAAEQLFRRACLMSGGALETAEPLLSLWVDVLMADEQALELEDSLPPATRRSPGVCVLLALAHARRGQWQRGEALLRRDDHPRAIEAIVACARAALRQGRADRAELLWARARALDPSEPSVHELMAEIRARQASEQEDAELRLLELIARRCPGGCGPSVVPGCGAFAP